MLRVTTIMRQSAMHHYLRGGMAFGHLHNIFEMVMAPSILSHEVYGQEYLFDGDIETVTEACTVVARMIQKLLSSFDLANLISHIKIGLADLNLTKRFLPTPIPTRRG